MRCHQNLFYQTIVLREGANNKVLSKNFEAVTYQANDMMMYLKAWDFLIKQGILRI